MSPRPYFLDEATKLKAMRELQAENERLKKEMKEATLNAAAEGYKKRLRQEAVAEELDRKMQAFQQEHGFQPPAAALFHEGGGSPMGKMSCYVPVVSCFSR
jgi:16S rRNA C967 or C1407 C5-methylase (RsmB/RsmF family)